ncbi:MAG TPA: TIGR01212 family radical SAM protein [Bacteroidales bacterium]|nr:TIGR01212 family radical SAM protein [Bacteroidales bacterium]
MQKNYNNILPWNDYSTYVKSIFGCRVQKISVDAGFTCPNRDGTLSSEACIYCTNESFSPFYCNPKLSVSEQLNKGIAFFSPKYKTQKYLAYFQSYTNTYKDVKTLKKLYLEALSVDGVIGLVIATRPDCIDEKILTMLSEISRDNYINIEFGAESTNDNTLNFINRSHSWQQTIDAVELTNKYGINSGLHIILGLPGETENDFSDHAKKISTLPIKTLKIHQMQVLKGTKLESVFNNNPGIFFDLNLHNYKRIIINFLELLNPEIIIERFTSESPKHLLIYPDWKGKKNFEISHIVAAEMKKLNSYQGRQYNNGTV